LHWPCVLAQFLGSFDSWGCAWVRSLKVSDIAPFSFHEVGDVIEFCLGVTLSTTGQAHPSRPPHRSSPRLLTATLSAMFSAFLPSVSGFSSGFRFKPAILASYWRFGLQKSTFTRTNTRTVSTRRLAPGILLLFTVDPMLRSSRRFACLCPSGLWLVSQTDSILLKLITQFPLRFFLGRYLLVRLFICDPMMQYLILDAVGTLPSVLTFFPDTLGFASSPYCHHRIAGWDFHFIIRSQNIAFVAVVRNVSIIGFQLFTGANSIVKEGLHPCCIIDTRLI